mmetsp:Transcript_15269/g.53677  ORF Transcript_15269/g.53677 Transcript_15269/m.53677 type:complete len:229 (+) Transcript_15269:313-999(+)
MVGVARPTAMAERPVASKPKRAGGCSNLQLFWYLHQPLLFQCTHTVSLTTPGRNLCCIMPRWFLAQPRPPAVTVAPPALVLKPSRAEAKFATGDVAKRRCSPRGASPQLPTTSASRPARAQLEASREGSLPKASLEEPDLGVECARSVVPPPPAPLSLRERVVMDSPAVVEPSSECSLKGYSSKSTPAPAPASDPACTQLAAHAQEAARAELSPPSKGCDNCPFTAAT